jgi:hypothetical protein
MFKFWSSLTASRAAKSPVNRKDMKSLTIQRAMQYSSSKALIGF